MSVTPDLLPSLVKARFGLCLETDLNLAAGTASGRGFFCVQEGLSFGHALLWASKQKLETLTLLAVDPEVAASITRLATAYSSEELCIESFLLLGGEFQEVAPSGAPTPPAAPQHLLDEATGLAQSIDCDVVSQRSKQWGEYASITCYGLEIARVVDHEGSAVTEIGVGQADREINALTQVASIQERISLVADKVSTVRHRERNAQHPLAQLDRAGYLRSLASEELVDLPNLISDDQFSANPRVGLNPEKKSLWVFAANEYAPVFQVVADWLEIMAASPIDKVYIAVPEADSKYLDFAAVSFLGVETAIESLN